MRIGTHGSVVRSMQTLYESGSAAGLTDRELLERFLAGQVQGEAAFSAAGRAPWSAGLERLSGHAG